MICFGNEQIILSFLRLHPTTKAEEAETERFYDDLQDVLELTPKIDVLFITGDWNANIGSQEIPGVTGKFSLGVKTWTSPDGQHRNQTDKFFAAKDEEALYGQ